MQSVQPVGLVAYRATAYTYCFMFGLDGFLRRKRYLNALNVDFPPIYYIVSPLENSANLSIIWFLGMPGFKINKNVQAFMCYI